MVCFAVLNVSVVWQLRDRIFRGYGDFAAFYTAGVIVQRGSAARLYDRGLQWQIQQEFSSTVDQRRWPLPFIRPPFEALLFAPLAKFTYPTALVIWSAAKLIVLMVIPFLIPSQFRLSPGILSNSFLGLLSLAYFPIAFDFLQGQDAVLLLLILTLTFSGLQRKADFKTGILLSLGLFKFHIVVPIFLILAWRRGRILSAGFLVGGLVLIWISAALVGWSNLASYPRYLWDFNQAPHSAGFYPSMMPNFRGLAAMFLGNGALPVCIQLFLMALLVAGIVLGSKLPPCRVERYGQAVLFSFSIVISLVTSLYGNLCDLTLILLPMLLLGGEYLRVRRVPDWPRKIFLICVAVLLISPVFWLDIFYYRRFYWVAMILGIMGSCLGLLATAEPDLQYPIAQVRLAQPKEL